MRKMVRWVYCLVKGWAGSCSGRPLVHPQHTYVHKMDIDTRRSGEGRGWLDRTNPHIDTYAQDNKPRQPWLDIDVMCGQDCCCSGRQLQLPGAARGGGLVSPPDNSIHKDKRINIPLRLHNTHQQHHNTNIVQAGDSILQACLTGDGHIYQLFFVHLKSIFCLD